jgi:hypothetical protein
MVPVIQCELPYHKSPHLQQLYAGFVRLQAQGVVELRLQSVSDSGASRLPILPVTVNDRIRVVYDALDGLNWIPGTIQENLSFFQQTFRADYYFKRSFTQQVASAAPTGCTVLPLGLNYHVKPETDLRHSSVVERLREALRHNAFASDLIGATNDDMALPAGDYEHHPTLEQEARVLLLTRLWDPADFDGDKRAQIEALNDSRISAVSTCQKQFADRFCGGLSDSRFTRKSAKALIAPLSLTNKKRYLDLVKSHAICIGTHGLHGSIGWKFGEYVAASRAIVSEPLRYEVPGDFRKGKNFLEYVHPEELIGGVDSLLRNKSALSKMMQENYRYYHLFVRPERLVWNSLRQAVEGQEPYRAAAAKSTS